MSLVAGMLVLAMACAASQSPQGEGAAGSPDTGPGEKAPATKDRWFVEGGMTNYHSPLKEAEAKVDQQINGVLGILFPTWEKPATFKDWSDEGKEWNGSLGFGRELGAKWDAFVHAGLAFAKMDEAEFYYPAGNRVKVEVHFEHVQYLAEAGLDYYPAGRAARPPKDGKRGLRLVDTLRSSKPFISLAAGGKRYVESGGVRFRFSEIGSGINITEKYVYDVLHVNPRLGVEVPVSKRDSVLLSGGYMFFNAHQREFNSAIIGVVFRHAF